jgi:hypothetical protein
MTSVTALMQGWGDTRFPGKRRIFAPFLDGRPRRKTDAVGVELWRDGTIRGEEPFMSVTIDGEKHPSEVCHNNSHLCPRVDRPSNPGPNHRPVWMSNQLLRPSCADEAIVHHEDLSAEHRSSSST